MSPAQIKRANEYRVGCDKCQLDLDSTRKALEESQVSSSDHSLTVAVGFVALLIGAAIGTSMARGNR